VRGNRFGRTGASWFCEIAWEAGALEPQISIAVKQIASSWIFAFRGKRHQLASLKGSMDSNTGLAGSRWACVRQAHGLCHSAWLQAACPWARGCSAVRG